MQEQLDKAIEYYRKAIAIRRSSAQAYFNLGLVLKKKGDNKQAKQELRTAIQLDPTYLKPKNILGDILNTQGKCDQALEQYNDALTIDPNNFDAHFSIAEIQKGKNNFEKAVESYKKAIAIRPHDIRANFYLGYTYNVMGQLHKAVEIYKNIMVFAPTYTDVRCNLAHTLRYLGRVYEATEEYEKILQKWPHHASTHYGYAESLLKAGNFERGWPSFEWRWKRDTDPRGLSKNLWDGTDPAGKTILIRGEYGLGDTIQFIRFAKHLKELGATVIAEVQHALVSLFACCPYIDKLIPLYEKLPSFDAQVPVMSLPYRLGITAEESFAHDKPYFDIDQNLVQQWHTSLSQDSNFKIGICWEGSTYYDSIRGPLSKKAMHLSCFEKIAALPNVTLYSLQKTGARKQINDVDFEVREFGSHLDTTHGRFMDTAAIMKNLDLVLTVDTSLAHLAGALNRPVWVVLPTVADWRWMLDRNDTPWYPTMRLFRQTTNGDWDSVFANVQQALTCHLQHREKKSGIITVEISIGELIDKITILQLKTKYIKETAKLKNVNTELDILIDTKNMKIPPCQKLTTLTRKLYNANQKLWDIEDAIRNKERKKEFDDEFIQIARSVYFANADRCALKRKINLLLGSHLIEEKSHQAY